MVQKITLRTLAIALTTTLVGCSNTPTVQTGSEAEVVMGHLNRVDNISADMAYVDPNVDYRQYQAVRLLPLDLDHVEIVQPDKGSSLKGKSRREWTLSNNDRLQLTTIFQEVVNAAINGTKGLRVTDTKGEGVLAIKAIMTRIAPSAPKDDIVSRGVGRSVVYSQGAGSLSVSFIITDDRSGEVIALMKDTRGGQQSFWGPNNRVTNLSEVRRMFKHWAGQISRGLTYMKSLSETTASTE